MKKPIKIIISVLIILIIAILINIIFYYKSINKALIYNEVLSQNEYVQKAMKKYKVVECKFNLTNPEYALVALEHYVYPEDDVDRKIWHVTFHNFSRSNIFSPNWKIDYTGGTTIKNTTFPHLVKLVKQDCSQFQKSKGNHTDETINWSYSKKSVP